MAGSASRGVEYALALVWGEAALQRAEAEGAGPDTRHVFGQTTALHFAAEVKSDIIRHLIGLSDIRWAALR